MRIRFTALAWELGVSPLSNCIMLTFQRSTTAFQQPEGNSTTVFMFTRGPHASKYATEGRRERPFEFYQAYII